MKRRKAKKILRKSSAKLKEMLAEFDASKHGGEVMAYEPVGVEFPSKADPQGSTAPRYRTVDRKGRIYLAENLIGRVFRITSQADGTWLLEPTDDVPESERWAHAPKMARALERIGTEHGSEEIQSGQASRGAKPAALQTQAYEPDDGPLTKQEMKVLRARAAEKLPRGKLRKTSTLFPSNPGHSSAPLYVRSAGLDAYLAALCSAEPLQIVGVEREGFAPKFIRDLAQRMEWDGTRLRDVLGIRTSKGKRVRGERLYAAAEIMRLIRLIRLAREIAAGSTAGGAEAFDPIRWLGQWLDLPQPALGGLKSAELLDTDAGASMVARVLGAVEGSAHL